MKNAKSRYKRDVDLGEIDFTGIHWLIIGDESGPRARPMNKTWVQNIRDQCLAPSAPFFFKQWGGTEKHLNGRKLCRLTWDDFPAMA